MERDLVSIVTCVYNAGEFFRPAVMSVLAQTYSNLEILIVDDGSTDGCVSSISDVTDARVRVLRQKNSGKPAAMNRALSEIRGEFYAIQDADDLSHPRRIERQVESLRDNPDIAAVFCGHELILNGRHVAPRFVAKDRETCRREIERMDMPAHDPTGMYRTSMVGDLRYDEELHIAEGYDYITRVGERFPMLVLGECLYSYRVHWNSLTRQDPERRQQLLRRAAEKLLERRCLRAEAHNLPAIQLGNVTNKDKDNDLVSHFMLSMVDLRNAGRWREAVRNAVCCIMMHPADLLYYKPAMYALAPVQLIRWYRRKREG